jgi:hypothetical protein
MKRSIAIRLCLSAPQFNNVACGESNFKPTNKVSGRAVFEGARARRVGRNCPAEITTPLGRVRRVNQSVPADGSLEIRQHDASLSNCPAALFFAHNLFNMIQAFCCQYDSAKRHAPTDNARARTRNCDRHTLARRFDKNTGNFL